MNVFELLSDDSAHTSARLREAASCYSEWTFDRVFESTKKSLESIKQHLDKEQLLLNNLKKTAGLEEVVSKFSEQKKDILSEMESLVMLHVDEPGFEQELEEIAAKFDAHRDYCRDTFYPAMEKSLSSSDFAHVQEQFGQIILS